MIKSKIFNLILVLSLVGIFIVGLDYVSAYNMDLSCRNVRSTAITNPIVKGEAFNPQDYVKDVLPEKFTPRSKQEIMQIKNEILNQERKVTVSIIKADVGSLGGHTKVHPDLLKIGEAALEKAKEKGLILDYYVFNAGDDLELVVTHDFGSDNELIHELCWNTFEAGAKRAKDLGLYGAGQDLLKDTFVGNIAGMGPGFAEATFYERKAEPFVLLAADKSSPYGLSRALTTMFTDTSNTPGLYIDSNMGNFKLEIWDVEKHRRIFLNSSTQKEEIAALTGSPRFLIKRVYDAEGNVVASASTEKLSKIAGEYVGKDDPVAIVRAQHGLPAAGEITEPFAKQPIVTEGFMRGSHYGFLTPVTLGQSQVGRFDGPPIVLALSFTLNGGMLGEVLDLFGAVSFRKAQEEALGMNDKFRKHIGDAEPHRLPPGVMEYTKIPDTIESLNWKTIPESEEEEGEEG